MDQQHPIKPSNTSDLSIKPEFNYYSLRSRQARLTTGITPIWRLMLQIMAGGMLVMGICLIILELSVGWLIIGWASLPMMVYQWWRWHLYRLKISSDPTTVDDVLSSSVLGRLPENPSPYDIASIAGTTSGGVFLAVRFGVVVNLLQEIASKDVADTKKIWLDALEIRQQTNSHTLSGGCLALAVIKNLPGYEQILAQLRLDFEDLKQGVCWHDYLHLRKQESQRFVKTGGIARDWSFGYTPLLKHFGQNISEQLTGGRLMSAKIPAHQAAIEHMIELFGSGGRQNVALVGAYGVGKTNIVYGFAERLLDAGAELPANLRFRQVVMLDAASLLSAAPERGHLEGLISQVFGEAFSAQNIIICLDNAELFFEDGTGSVDLTNLLLPVIESGKMRLILTMDEQKFLQISQRTPSLANALNKIIVAPSSQKDTMLILQDKVVSLEGRLGVIFMYQALKEAYRLGGRYINDVAMPGQAIKLLESSANYHENGLVRFTSIQQALEKTIGVKISSVLQAEERSVLLNLEKLLHQRLIGQERAVQVISDALRRQRAGVHSQNRPIGTFLFLGPTGVGKTELAKALSEVYFNGEDNIIRLDLNEYVTANDVGRLIENAAQNQYSLTAQVLRQPFSVVLLDEIEKAHPAVLTTLLQVLDEGVLRDTNNKEISFRDTIIIATSNAGALEIQDYISRGVKISDFETEFIEKLIQSHKFRPEFLNRFDEIVLFRPLEKAELLKIIDLILTKLNQTLASQKIEIKVPEEVKLYLLEKGYNPQFGARPMRRVIQQTVENIVAKTIITGEITGQQTIEISLDDLKNY
ncbi:MAG: ATP-dependent Clp protease ATP-binding subunit [Candidatus Saccharibacteria bacterium]|nr:ATP-dependent Clp protease ATP-binding subunit [Candidatus Saccharibacteria bacterium]